MLGSDCRSSFDADATIIIVDVEAIDRVGGMVTTSLLYSLCDHIVLDMCHNKNGHHHHTMTRAHTTV